MKKPPRKFQVMKDGQVIASGRSMHKAIMSSGAVNADGYCLSSPWTSEPVYPITWEISGINANQGFTVIESVIA